MKKYHFFEAGNGFWRESILTSDKSDGKPRKGYIVRSADKVGDDFGEYSYLKDGKVVDLGEPPDTCYELDEDKKEWVFDKDIAWRKIRRKRDKMLNETDWVKHRSDEQGKDMPDEWREYRQALRDITDQDDPRDIEWPEKPE